MFLLLIEVVFVVGRQSGEKESETNRRTWKERLFCSGAAWQLQEKRIHKLRSNVLAKVMQLIISFRVRVKGEGLYSSVHTSAAASKVPLLVWFPVPKVLSPHFQTGSLVCNIISNTLGYRLILLWCHHWRKSAGMCPEPLWLAPLCLGVSHPRSTFLLIANVRVTDDPSSCSTSFHCVSKI